MKDGELATAAFEHKNRGEKLRQDKLNQKAAATMAYGRATVVVFVFCSFEFGIASVLAD